MAGGIITLLLAVTAILLLYPKDSLTLWLVEIVAAGTMFQPFETINFWFQSQVQSQYTAVAKNSVSLLVAGIRIGLILVQASVITFAGVTLADVALAGLAIALVYQSKGNNFKLWRVSWQRGKKLGASQFCSQARNWSFEARGRRQEAGGRRKNERGRRKEPKEVFLQI
ncbi:hypothetical protein QUB05_16680 [Microcoleus sp. F10-C6]|uniref:hypothetical protein n=1 Tax=unclassified Microcoleus TaxID=2642155 RepID=UPI002FD53967